MSDKLQEMSLQELWQKFPIVLTEHQDCWQDWYEEEVQELKKILSLTQIKRISHIGSTAIKGIWAKPIIDILVEISKESDMLRERDILVKRGWRCMSEAPGRIGFNKGYTEQGFAERVFHLHLRYEGDNNELYFRDYMNQYPEAAKGYEALKRKLWKQYEYNRDDYTEAKTEFIKGYTKSAKRLYGTLYEE